MERNWNQKIICSVKGCLWWRVGLHLCKSVMAFRCDLLHRIATPCGNIFICCLHCVRTDGPTRSSTYSKAAGAACNQATLSPAAEQTSAGVSSYTTGSLSYVSLTLDSDRLCGCLQQPVELLCCFHSSATACLLHVLCGFEWPCYIAYVANSLWLVGAPGHRPTGP